MSELNLRVFALSAATAAQSQTQGLFQEHTQAEKENLMREYCAKISTEKVAAYCRYCVRGLKLGGKSAFHLAQLLFESEKILRT